MNSGTGGRDRKREKRERERERERGREGEREANTDEVRERDGNRQGRTEPAQCGLCTVGGAVIRKSLRAYAYCWFPLSHEIVSYTECTATDSCDTASDSTCWRCVPFLVVLFCQLPGTVGQWFST